MRLSCLQENLSQGLSVVQRAVATRTPLPITQNVHLSTDNSRLKLAATNLEIAISTWIGAQVEEEGSITIPARLLTEFVNSLPQEPINIAMVQQPLGLKLSCARFDAHINGQDADDFPPIPTVDTGIIGKISAAVLKDAITHVAFAAATEDSRPVLTGVKVEITGDDFTFAAADGFRLAVFEGKLLEPISEDISFLMPARTFLEVNRLIGSQDATIEFTVTPSKSQALFRLENVEIVSQLVQGTFPNYSQLIPDSFDTRAVVDQSAFLSATRTASIFARDGSGIVRLNSSPSENGAGGKLSISSRAEELGDNEGEIDAAVEGPESKIAFNSKYLTEVLDVLGTGEIALETTTPSSPGVIRPLTKDGYVHVVMPMFVQW
ncbi:MAG: DNA polymerase III subunit beta [SAR202 cluster bacterium]|nr:DNA polymerase III subunit beta [SAR202 cluster bacterium]MQG68561.1 DNA polymerase III subunit beta [SAR202 cluster bacterium]HAL46356.1 DNA polymerase III subunit beta [Dehalococcoidia bacterium]|tara:strand:- start:2029 stop:3162 length:1134 start_codon:yes stop_codon:yes gene_type:complete